MANQLQHETSPYLLQHAHNPVNWYPWGEEAFRRARQEDKPVFLSIGYSTCHWCHVMAHESFEDAETAQVLNQHFISIKVDKEERPDIDSIYMAVCQAFTGSGGWPTSIFMTADQKPFFAGTYFPPDTRRGMIGFRDLLTRIHEIWTTDRDALLQQAEQLVEQLRPRKTSGGGADPQLLDLAVSVYRKLYDPRHGGFGNAPKFPTPHNLLFLLEYHQRYRDSACLEMAEHTLVQMYRGGLFDHIGFGFCRYSTDARFLVPHFEKMLYDNAMLILAYCKAYTVTKKELYRTIAEKTADYVLREMTGSEGGFYSAQDADSEGEEGKYYLFTPDEITALLGQETGAAFCLRFDITQRGNFEGKNIPNLLGCDGSAPSFEAVLPTLAQYRKTRYPLHLDDKVLTFWNALMIAAMCRLYRASGQERYLTAARRADRFLQANLWQNDTLFVSFRAGKRGKSGFLDDYAGYIFALLALYDATLKENYLSRARQLFQLVCDQFQDREGGGFYLYGSRSETLILRPKETYDGAVPSGNALMAWNLVRLSQLTGDPQYEDLAQRQLDFLAGEAGRYPVGHAMFLLALLEHTTPPPTVTAVLKDPSDAEGLPLLLPSDAAVVVLNGPTEEYPLKEDKTTFYVCQNHSCLPPVHDLRGVWP